MSNIITAVMYDAAGRISQSMRAPAGHPVRDFDGTAVRGSWNFLGNYRGYDHFDILNWPNKGPSADPVYERISDILFAL